MKKKKKKTRNSQLPIEILKTLGRVISTKNYHSNFHDIGLIWACKMTIDISMIRNFRATIIGTGPFRVCNSNQNYKRCLPDKNFCETIKQTAYKLENKQKYSRFLVKWTLSLSIHFYSFHFIEVLFIYLSSCFLLLPSGLWYFFWLLS